MDRIRVIMMAVTAMFCMTVTAQNQTCSITAAESTRNMYIQTKTAA